MTLQYRTITEHAAWADVSARGRLRFDGPDAAAFLHALVTNDVTGLAPGRGVYAAWLTPQGRMIADLRLLRDAGAVLAEVPAGLAPELQARFDALLFSEDVRVTDVSAATRAFLVAGGRAAHVAAAAAGVDPAQVDALPVLGHLDAGEHRVIRIDDTALPTFAVWTAAGAEPAALFPGVPSMPDGLLEGLRIAAGRPLFGVDMTTDTIPLEAGLRDRAISESKGCYVGQEVIVRILHRGGGRVVKHLVQLRLDDVVTTVPAAGTPLLLDGAEVGAMTSAAVSPETGGVIALAYVHRDAAEVGRMLRTPAHGTATITALAG